MLSLLIQVRAVESDQVKEARLAQMRDNNAEVGDNLLMLMMMVMELVINPTFFACMHIIWSIGEGQAGGAHQHRLLEGPASLSPLWSAPLALGDIKCLLQERRPL